MTIEEMAKLLTERDAEIWLLKEEVRHLKEMIAAMRAEEARRELEHQNRDE